MTALTDREMLDDQEMKRLIFEAMQIVAGDTMKLATKRHLIALLEERTNLVAALAVAKDGLADAAEALTGKDKSMAIAFLKDTQAQLMEAGFVERLESDWVRKVLRGAVEHGQ